MATKTAMMEHIKWLNEVINIAQAQQMNADIIQAIEYVLEGAKAKLQMEKEHLMMAFNDGRVNAGLKLNRTSEQYYNETYGE
jgi:hypothetical protein